MAQHDRRKQHGKTYWLDDPRNVTKIFFGLIGAGALWLGADLVDRFVVHYKHPEFERFGGWADGGIGFYPVYGFVGAFLLVLAAKRMRRLLMRPEDYYDRRRGGAPDRQ